MLGSVLPALHWKCPHYYHAKELAEHLYTQHHIYTHTHTLSEMTQMGATKQGKCGFAYIQKCSQQWEATGSCRELGCVVSENHCFCPLFTLLLPHMDSRTQDTDAVVLLLTLTSPVMTYPMSGPAGQDL